MPMAGRGIRFVNAGYQTPKQLIEVRGKKVIEWAISSLPQLANFIFVVHAQQNELFNISETLKKIVPNCTIIETPVTTDGPVCTALLAHKYMDHNELIIADSDFYTIWNYNRFRKYCTDKRLDSCSLSEISINPKNSYVLLENDLIVRAKEKEVISNISPHGIHWFRKGDYFRKAADSLISKNIRYNNEFYCTPCLQELAEMNYRCGIYYSDAHYPLGIPEDIRKFENVQL